jgi:AcrR family transcriptional regulator
MSPDNPFTIDDPLDSLPITAQRIVAAARRLLARDGFEALTVERIARESGEYKDAVRYYFGGKAGLIATVVASFAHDSSLGSAQKTRSVPTGEGKVEALLDADLRLAGDVASSRDFLTILPHTLRDEDMRVRIAGLYDWYRDLYVRCLDEGIGEERRARLQLLAGLMVAVIDGLSIQKAIDPEGVDLEPLFALWKELVTAGLGESVADAR